jgi:DNA-binding transcriptional regulator YdaS (Cro superfamily)
MKLAEWIAAERGRARRLAEHLGLSNPENPVLVYQWSKAPPIGRPVPAERCPSIQRFTNGDVTCEELRPDVDWAALREVPPAQPQAAPGTGA